MKSGALYFPWRVHSNSSHNASGCVDKVTRLTAQDCDAVVSRMLSLCSGGKDSCYSMMQCVAAGHQIVALANLQPQDNGQHCLTLSIAQYVW